ncbi:hypothetical protein AB0H83_23315 [Dactylosporangium sp. NPDC050688]|uniref:hypothetical protein n=1 Tax=Dactylosporangium sp. NPDC050688 TaxID=3157217 RepID=UPI0033EE3007
MTATAAAILVVLTTAAVAVTRSGNHATPGVASPTPGPTLPASPTAPGTAATNETAGPSDAKALLERFADDLRNAPADPARARFEYLSLRIWDSFAAPPAASPDGAAAPVRRTQLWTSGQGSTRAVELDENHGCRLLRDETGTELGPFDGPLPRDPDAIRRHILHEPQPPGTVIDVFGQIADFYSARFVPLAARQGILRMLARQPGIHVQPQVTDRAGRTGIAVTLTFQPPMPFTVAKTLIFDPRTGQLLASHSQAHRRPDATTPPDPTDQYEIYLLTLTSTYTPDVHTPAAGCAG